MGYTIALFLHVLGAIGLFVAMSLYLVSVVHVRQAQTVEQVRDWISLAAKAGPGIGGSSLILLAPAIYMVLTVWGFGTPWVLASLIVFVLQWVLGSAIGGRHAATVLQAAKAAPLGPVPPALREQISSPALWLGEVIRIALLVGVVFLMTNKPGLAGTLIALGGALVLGLICALLLGRIGPSRQRGEVPA
ncbi:MAG: hypothetical protein NVSMB27_45050 [Ktedonobacteraceae bacterium]